MKGWKSWCRKGRSRPVFVGLESIRTRPPGSAAQTHRELHGRAVWDGDVLPRGTEHEGSSGVGATALRVRSE